MKRLLIITSALFLSYGLCFASPDSPECNEGSCGEAPESFSDRQKKVALANIPPTDGEENASLKYVCYGAAAITLLLLTLFIVLLIRIMREIRKLDWEITDKYRTLEGENEFLKSHQSKSQQEIRKLCGDVRDLKQEILLLQHTSKVMLTVPVTLSTPVCVSNKLYAASINDGYFFRVTEVPTDDTIFELTTTTDDGKNATFTIYPVAQERVKSRPNLIEGCDVQRVENNGAFDIECGTAQERDGKWKIITEAKVKI